MMRANSKRLALVLSGGGARGAYEAGVLHYIRTMLPASVRSRQFDIHCGASVGGLNTCVMAAYAHNAKLQGEKIRKLWEEVREENIYRRNLTALARFLSTSGVGLVTKLIRGAGKGNAHFPGFLDTAPFLPYLQKHLPWDQISRNIRDRLTQAVSIVATNVFTGRVELFIDKNPSIQYSGDAIIHYTPIHAEHAAASAAIPIVFPTVLVNGIAYTDGGLRLNTPLSPAIHLGADSIFVIGLNHRAQPGEKTPFHGELGKSPSLGQVMGRVLNTVFLDRIQYDMEQLERINRIVDWGEMLYGEKFVVDLNQMLNKKAIRGDIAERGLKRLNVFRMRPSEDIAEIFSDCYQKGREGHFTTFEKFLIRVLDIDPNSGVDFLSYLIFMPEYIRALLDLGFEDARKNHQQILEFMDQ